MKSLSQLVESAPASVTAAMMQKGRELAAAGHDIINLAGGEPDFNTPAHIVEAAFQAIRAGDTHYPPSHGTPALLEAIVAKLQRENNVHHITPNQVLATPGGKWAIYVALAVTLNPGDEVLVLDPSWVSYGPMVELNRGVPVRVPLPSNDNFRISEELLRRYITPRTKLIMVNSPNNPTGRVMTRSELEALCKVAIEHDLYVLSDEIYEHIVFDGAVHYSPAAEPGMAERTLIVNGFSKAYAMTGWRLAWLAGPAPVMKLARNYQTQSVTSAASFTMAAGVAALNGPQECVRQMTAAYAERRRFMLDALEEIPGIECPPIEGAFYIFPKFTQTDKSSLEIANVLLEKSLIATTPGIAFGPAGEGHVRFSIATHMHDLERTVERLAQIVPAL
ncbi:MAG TPA: pyridoxal phosphate-dependent aminotransferase [Caldilineaceae bacterium]|nr:pyridoxal phosphate-dependent aminotransferase [Caldilineaceae bacterium]